MNPYFRSSNEVRGDDKRDNICVDRWRLDFWVTNCDDIVKIDDDIVRAW